MVAWIVFAVSMVGGLVLLGLLGWRLFGQLKSLLGALGRSAERVAAASEQLATVAPPARDREENAR